MVLHFPKILFWADILLFSIRLVDAFKLHKQLNVRAQKLPEGATRKVCGMCDVILSADVVAGNKVLLHFSVVFCAEHPGRFACPASGWAIDRHGPRRTTANVVSVIITLRAASRNLMYGCVFKPILNGAPGWLSREGMQLWLSGLWAQAPRWVV